MADSWSFPKAGANVSSSPSTGPGLDQVFGAKRPGASDLWDGSLGLAAKLPRLGGDYAGAGFVARGPPTFVRPPGKGGCGKLTVPGLRPPMVPSFFGPGGSVPSLRPPLHMQFRGMMPAPAPVEQVISSDFQIPASKVKDVLGVKGRNIKAIKFQAGVHKIAIMDRSEPAVVTVTGTEAAIEKAKSMVLAVCAGDQSVIGNVVDTLDIDQKMVSKFIGPKGQVITQLKELSGAYLEVRETGAGQPPKIIMTGPPDCVARGRELCLQFLANQGSSPGHDGSAASAFSGAQAALDPYSQYLAQATAKRLRAPTEEARLQEGLIHAQLQEASIQASMQEANLQGAQFQALASVQQALQAQLAAQRTALALGGGGQQQDLQALYAYFAVQQQQSQQAQQSLQTDVAQLLQMATAGAATTSGEVAGQLPGSQFSATLPGGDLSSIFGLVAAAAAAPAASAAGAGADPFAAAAYGGFPIAAGTGDFSAAAAQLVAADPNSLQPSPEQIQQMLSALQAMTNPQ
mmetsp:Transcript_22916/g.78066  ORF Transcript_22916/g.78066 Transcript_22916/m.78066 type:complete len:516 (-) Transcript_22916:130-1677(-)